MASVNFGRVCIDSKVWAPHQSNVSAGFCSFCMVGSVEPGCTGDGEQGKESINSDLERMCKSKDKNLTTNKKKGG